MLFTFSLKQEPKRRGKADHIIGTSNQASSPSTSRTTIHQARKSSEIPSFKGQEGRHTESFMDQAAAAAMELLRN
jgi:hypothetical protein